MFDCLLISALLRNPTSCTLHERFSSIRATVQRKLGWMENNWWVWKAAQIESNANINHAKNFYEALIGVYGPSHFLHPVRSTDGILLKNKELILARWAEDLLYKVHTTDPGFLDDLPTLLIIAKLDDPPFFDDVVKAILSLKDNKTASPDNIPVEVVVVSSPHQSPRCGESWFRSALSITIPLSVCPASISPAH